MRPIPGRRTIKLPARSAGFAALCLCFFTSTGGPAQAEAPLVSELPPQPDVTFCSIDKQEETASAPIPCDLPGLPCGPVAANKIRAGLVPTADLDGDGRADLAFLGRRGGDNSASYSVIFRSTPEGYVLADYHELSYGIGPALPRVVLPITKAAPIIEDGRDEPLVQGNSVSVRRLRRWNGTRFVTLLTYCKNHLLFEQGKPAHTAGQRIVGVDVDNDGATEVVIRGFDRPRVFRITPDGQALTEDAGLTEAYRQTLPNHQQALTLQKQAAELAKNSAQLPRSVKLLNRARLMAPYEVNIALDLADGVLRMHRGAQVIALLEQTRGLDRKRAEPDCLLGRAYEQTGDRAKEQAALESCLKLSPPPAFQQSAAQRMKELGK